MKKIIVILTIITALAATSCTNNYDEGYQAGYQAGYWADIREQDTRVSLSASDACMLRLAWNSLGTISIRSIQSIEDINNNLNPCIEAIKATCAPPTPQCWIQVLDRYAE